MKVASQLSSFVEARCPMSTILIARSADDASARAPRRSSSSISARSAGCLWGIRSLLRPAAMLNVLGDLWCNGSPNRTPVLSQPNARLHLYGKRRASPGRKMRHVLILGDDVERACTVVETVAAALERGASASMAQHGEARG